MVKKEHFCKLLRRMKLHSQECMVDVCRSLETVISRRRRLVRILKPRTTVMLTARYS